MARNHDGGAPRSWTTALYVIRIEHIWTFSREMRDGRLEWAGAAVFRRERASPRQKRILTYSAEHPFPSENPHAKRGLYENG